MKPLLSLLLLAAIGITNTADAQDLTHQTEEIANIVYKKATDNSLDGIDATGAHQLLQQFDTEESIKKKKEKLYGTGYSKPIVFVAQPGETNRMAFLRSIPVPQMPEPAWQTDRKIYEQYADKLQVHVKQLQSQAVALVNTTEDAKLYNEGGEAALKKKYASQANQNPMVASMGGVENIEKMSDQQRQQAAAKAVADMTGGLTPEQIRNMTPEQQRALAMRMAANNTPQRVANAGNQQEALEIMKIEKWQAQFREETQRLMEPIGKLISANEKETDGKMKAIANWASRITETLPEVSDSEYGPRKVGQEYVTYTEHFLQYYAGREDIARRIEIWEKTVRAYLNLFKKLDDFEATYRGRNDLSDRMKTTVANILVAGYDTILDLTKQADFITGLAAGRQADFNCHIRKDCGDAKK